MQDNVINLTEKRLKKSPVCYVVRFTHDEKGLSFFVDGVQDADKDRRAVAADMRAAADSLIAGLTTAFSEG